MNDFMGQPGGFNNATDPNQARYLHDKQMSYIADETTAATKGVEDLFEIVDRKYDLTRKQQLAGEQELRILREETTYRSLHKEINAIKTAAAVRNETELRGLKQRKKIQDHYEDLRVEYEQSRDVSALKVSMILENQKWQKAAEYQEALNAAKEAREAELYALELANGGKLTEARIKEIRVQLNHEMNLHSKLTEFQLEKIQAVAEVQKGYADELAKAHDIQANAAFYRDKAREEEIAKVRTAALKEYENLVAAGKLFPGGLSADEYADLMERAHTRDKNIEERGRSREARHTATQDIKKTMTLKEKKAAYEDHIKLAAASRDWSGSKYEIKDDMSEAEKASVMAARENAVKMQEATDAIVEGLGNLADKLMNLATEIGSYQADIDTRLQGSKNDKNLLGSYWGSITKTMAKIGAVSPYFTQKQFADNITSLVKQGIAHNITQRAFLMTIKDKIATTFDAADGTLLRLVRLQQKDSSAARLGMESVLNSFLNQAYETTEYLSDAAASVRGSLLELQSFEKAEVATEIEYQIQKWLGSLYSTGMSQEAVSSIATTFGQIAAGQIEGVTNQGTGNLLIMAANEAGISIADILREGLDVKNTNNLMQAMVTFLSEIAESTSDNRVVQQQLANVYGLNASDLKAVVNMKDDIDWLSKDLSGNSDFMGQLNLMANTLALRTHMGEMLGNIEDNVNWTMASAMSKNPILYLLPKVAKLLDDAVGGIALPFVNVYGFGVDLNTTVSELMRVASMSGTILSALGPMISGLASAANGTAMLMAAGINPFATNFSVVQRGKSRASAAAAGGGSSTSSSGYVGNASGDDVQSSTMQDAEDSKESEAVKAKEELGPQAIDRIDENVLKIYELLSQAQIGTSLKVHVTNLPGTNSSGDNGNWVLT